MFPKIQSRLSLVLGAMLLFTAPAVLAQRGNGNGSSDRPSANRGGGNQRGDRNFSSGQNRAYSNRGGQVYNSRNRYVAPPRAYVGGGYSSGRFYAGRGYFYGGSFWARPFFGIGIGIPFGYGYNTGRGCGYVDNFGRFFPAPCYSGY